MQPVIVIPIHDPDGLMFPQLEAIVPQLKELFAKAFISVTPKTCETQSKYISRLKTDAFFKVTFPQNSVSVGDDFLALYTHTVASCHPNSILHLCFIDRVAFALQSQYREQFIADIQSLKEEQTPLIFQRSKVAWKTHPRNYLELEQIVTKVGELLFRRSLDFAWCHLAIQAHQLQTVLPYIRRRDISMEAEIVLMLKDKIQTKDVDWLSWEDPFIYSRNPQQLKKEREQSVTETHKRLAYVIPMLQLLDEAVNE